MTAELREVRPDEDIAKERRQAIGRAVTNAIRAHKGKMAGFALVTWDGRGEPGASYLCGGPISSRLMPAFVHDELNRAVTIHMMEDRMNGTEDE